MGQVGRRVEVPECLGKDLTHKALQLRKVIDGGSDDLHRLPLGSRSGRVQPPLTAGLP
jgi:hypothetical protein